MIDIEFGNPGMPRKKFTKLLDSIWRGESIKGDPGMMEELDEVQAVVVREVMRCVARNNK